jgi:hypothetical protein
LVPERFDHVPPDNSEDVTTIVRVLLATDTEDIEDAIGFEFSISNFILKLDATSPLTEEIFDIGI